MTVVSKKRSIWHTKNFRENQTEVKLNDASKELFRAALHQILHVNGKQDKKELTAITEQIIKIEAA